MPFTVFDLAIIGGGPAGTSAAITAAERGVRVLLCEAGDGPRHKLCGEFVSPEGTAALAALGLGPALRARDAARLEDVRLTAPDGRVWDAPLPPGALGLSRYALDAMLLERAGAAGVTFRPATTITRIVGSLAQGFTLETSTRAQHAVEAAPRARVVIAAHGKRDALDRTLARRFMTRRQPFVAFKGHFQGPPLSPGVQLHAFPGGYCGLARVEEGVTNVCLLAHETIFRRASAGGGNRLEAFLCWMRAQNPYLKEWWREARALDARWISIAQIPFGPKEPVWREVLMAGDSAGLIAPLAGDGISMALQSGILAAHHSLAYLEGRTSAAELRRGYTRAWEQAFRARLAVSTPLQAIMLRPRVLSAGLGVVSRLPRAGAWLIAHTRGAGQD